MTALEGLRPSSAARIMACPGSYSLSKDVPRTTSSYAEEGIAAHAHLQDWLVFGLVPPEPFANNLQETYEYITDPSRTVLGIELSLPDDGVSPGGTVDVLLLSGDTIEVFDLKYGAGLVVEPERNPQMLRYLSRVRAVYGARPIYRLTVGQPRIEHSLGSIRSWDISDADLDLFMKDWRAAARNALSKSPRFAWGDQCRFCPANGSCQTFANGMLGKVMRRGKVVEVDAIDIDDLAAVLDIAELLPAWIKAVEKRAAVALQSGEHVPGWHMGAGRKSRTWTKAVDDLLPVLSEALDLQPSALQTTPELLSPPALEKRFKKLHQWQDITQYIVETYAPDSLKRGDAPLDTAAADEFAATPITNTL